MKLFVMGGFDGYECLNSIEMIDLKKIFEEV